MNIHRTSGCQLWLDRRGKLSTLSRHRRSPASRLCTKPLLFHLSLLQGALVGVLFGVASAPPDGVLNLPGSSSSGRNAATPFSRGWCLNLRD